MLVADHGVLQNTVAAPAAFVVWPLGPLFAPLVWDRATQELEAPNGVLSDTVRAEFGDELLDSTWAQPTLTPLDAKRE